MPSHPLVVRRLAPWVAALALGCNSPTLPLPPPLAPGVTAGPDADHVKLAATCNPAEGNAIIVVINQNPATPLDQAVGGALTNTCGAWDTIVYAHSGDLLDVTYQLDDQISLPTTVAVP